jgi:excinuclease ABC subunit C
MKDAEGRVLYVGKAKELRSRVCSYFQPSADLLNTRGPDICRMVDKVCSVDFLECETEVDALLKEARLIKDLRPPHNVQLRDDKTFPYIEITVKDDFPGVYVTRKPRLKGSKLFGPFTSAGAVRDAMNALQKVFKFRTCELEIREGDDSRKFFRPCLLHAINQCTAPCAALISQEDYAKDIDRLKKFMVSKRSVLIRQMTQEMEQASAESASRTPLSCATASRPSSRWNFPATCMRTSSRRSSTSTRARDSKGWPNCWNWSLPRAAWSASTSPTCRARRPWGR